MSEGIQGKTDDAVVADSLMATDPACTRGLVEMSWVVKFFGISDHILRSNYIYRGTSKRRGIDDGGKDDGNRRVGSNDFGNILSESRVPAVLELPKVVSSNTTKLVANRSARAHVLNSG